MRTSKIKAKLKRDEPVLLTTLHLTDPSLFELTSLMGFDGIWMDMEHHGYSVETATTLMRAARVGTADIVVRPAKGEFMRMGRMLEAGARASCTRAATAPTRPDRSSSGRSSPRSAGAASTAATPTCRTARCRWTATSGRRTSRRSS